MNHVIPGYLGSALLTLCEKTATPRSLTVAILLRNAEWDQLSTLEIDPGNYDTASDYYRDVVVTSFFRKVENLPTSFDRTKVAVENFWKCERSCYSANERLSPFLYGSLSDPRDGRISEFLANLRKEMTFILGPRPPGDLWGRFGPGATFADRGEKATIPHKMSSRPTITTSAIHFLFPWSGSAWASACAADGRDPLFVKGNRFTTVPKDCKKERGIAVEPSINIFFQLGVGAELRKKLRTNLSLDLNNAQDVHRQVACDASITGDLCTLDLSNASDTICTNLVRLALPHPWYEVLADLRSPYTYENGRWVKLEKFSSMGNGYTFELETCLFIGIISVVMKMTGHNPIVGTNLFVFGDDCIFPNECFNDVCAVLSFLGLSANKEKSYAHGWFRESCGGDFFRGVDVRPFYLKELPSEPQHLIALANGIRKLGQKASSDASVGDRFRSAWFRIIDALPVHLRRLRGPEDLGDIVIHDDESRWNHKWRDSIRYIRVYRPARYRKISWAGFGSDVVLAGATYGTPSGLPTGREWSTSAGVIPRDAVLGYKVAWCPFS